MATRRSNAIAICLCLLACGCARSTSVQQSPHPWMNTSLSPDQRATLLIHAMSLDDKITMVHGVHPIPITGYVGYVPPNPRLDIPALKLADGRAGVGNKATNVTLLPARPLPPRPVGILV